MSKEAYFISGFSSPHIGDDGAVIENKVYSKDLFCEGIHFKREWMSLEKIAQKSMLVNISDAIAMNAKPTLALLGIVIPKTFTLAQLKELSTGFETVAKEYSIAIIGGDTTAGDKLMISVTIISEVKRPIQRKNAKMGDLIAYTGSLGSSFKELTRLLRGAKVSTHSRFVTPVLKGKFFYRAAPYVHAGMDISDGLAKDLSRLCHASGVGVRFYKKLDKRLLCSGEEYEMLFTFAPRYRKTIEQIARKTRTKVTIFGRITRSHYRCFCKEHHF
ncbi:MAG: thiamine-phosphate kinase [Sulfurospirillaceae bacterium]|nr:thiamine-phosphate kinase [Sulfurospirillaceae bacterium]MDD2826187.1 thiamine-phosphate kinase [Sulfurospirillaceae bacterium]